jgi:hypothetical protein
MDILEFQGQYRWLSNFAPVRVTLDGITFPSAEHAYMSAKSTDVGWKTFCTTTPFAGIVKKASRKVKLVPNWDQEKFTVMQWLLEQKFSQEPYRTKLLATGAAYIQEGNLWNDIIWGVDLRTGRGNNVLGKMIMIIRDNMETKEDQNV